MNLSTRIHQLIPSATLLITARVRDLKRAGKDVIDLGVGEPDFNTPEHIIEAAKRAMDEGKTKYTPSGGIPELKQAIRHKFQRENDLIYENNQITVTVGAKQALYNIFQALLDPGDEVVIPSPYWVSYIEQVKLAGGQPVIVPGHQDNHFKLNAEQLRSAITHRTKALLLNSPSNPTGTVYTKEELKPIGEVCSEHDLLIISDEIYEHLIYDGQRHHSIASISDKIFERTVIINGVSKAYSMTGWRIGYAAGPCQIIKAMTDIAGHSTSNPTSISQYAAIAALNGPYYHIEEMQRIFKERRDYVVQRINSMPNLQCQKPSGAFYVYVDIRKALEHMGGTHPTAWAETLLEQELVAVIPGTAFGSSDDVRISYATSMDQLKKAMDRIERFVST